MPQDTTTMNQKTPALSDEQLLKDPASVEIYADQLMDDLFEDVERVLDGGAKLPSEPVEPEFISLKSIKVPQIILPPLARRDADDGAIDTDVKLRDASAGKDQSFDRILLGTAFASLLITLSLWVATRGGINRLFAPAPVAVPADKPLTAKTQADIKFADYIERSLATIQQQGASETIPLLPPFPVTPPVENLPPVPVPNTNTPNTPLGAETNNLIAAINRVAESIQDASDRTARLSNQVMQTLQQQAAQQQAAQQQAAQPQVSPPTPGGQTSGTLSAPPTQTAQTPQPSPQPTQQAQATPQPEPQAQPSPTQQAEEPQPQPAQQQAMSSVSIPTPASAPAPAPAPAPAEPAPVAEEQPSETAAATTSPSQGSIHTLVGILELGERSAALFEVNGVARRVYVGESIAASGWTLVEVVNQEAVIRRNGEVLTIYVGQQF
ncbi:hypothetical protein ACL6C3_11475 [Capilliphycus salinus ALCB114379]|uniref:hypothetical protein n=1 Tax=Capilliphycus salinus TaxID=2768948 RepID=UPI0039A4036A